MTREGQPWQCGPLVQYIALHQLMAAPIQHQNCRQPSCCGGGLSNPACKFQLPASDCVSDGRSPFRLWYNGLLQPAELPAMLSFACQKSSCSSDGGCHVSMLSAGECGGRADVRWTVLSSESGSGPALAAVTLSLPTQMNASRSAFHLILQDLLDVHFKRTARSSLVVNIAAW